MGSQRRRWKMPVRVIVATGRSAWFACQRALSRRRARDCCAKGERQRFPGSRSACLRIDRLDPAQLLHSSSGQSLHRGARKKRSTSVFMRTAVCQPLAETRSKTDCRRRLRHRDDRVADRSGKRTRSPLRVSPRIPEREPIVGLEIIEGQVRQVGHRIRLAPASRAPSARANIPGATRSRICSGVPPSTSFISARFRNKWQSCSQVKPMPP